MDYIITPETSSTFLKHSFHVTSQMMNIRRSMSDSVVNAVVFLGAWLVEQNGKPMNAVIGYSKKSPHLFRNKQKFIPFGEYIPLESTLGNYQAIKKLIPYQISQNENTSEVFRINKDVISPLICYEALFIDFLNDRCSDDGAEVFFVSASNSRINSMYNENRVKNIMISNAIITNRYIVRSTSNGLSYIVSNKGSIINENKNNDYFSDEICLNAVITFYASYYRIINLFYIITLLAMLIYFRFIAVLQNTTKHSKY